MKIKVILNKDIAFSGYLWNVLQMKKCPWIKRGPLKKVPEKLIEKTAKFSKPIQFSFERHPSKDFQKFTIGFKKILKEAENLHNKDWEKYKKDIKTAFDINKKLVKKYGNFIEKSIERTTKIKWLLKEIWIIPAIYSGGTVFNNKIFIGFSRDRSENFYLPLLIHELIHLNTNPTGREILENLKLPIDSNEITVVLLTNKVIEKLNEKFDLKIKPQPFHRGQQKFAKKYKIDLQEIGNKKQSYKSLIYAIDKFLSEKNYKSYFQILKRRSNLNL
jgi:hypothetical protein